MTDHAASTDLDPMLDTSSAILRAEAGHLDATLSALINHDSMVALRHLIEQDLLG